MNTNNTWLRRTGLAAGLMVLAATGAQAQPAERPLRFVVNVGLQNLDPISSPSFVTRNFGYMVFDTLVAQDSQGNFQPQMLESWTSSEDRLTWNFVLRPGLEFHDGAPVTAEDVVASLRRWGARDAIGRRLMAAMGEIRVTDARHFTFVLSRPFGGVIAALGKPSVHVPVIMPTRIASTTQPTAQATEIMGSGPFLFSRQDWIPGERANFRRNPRYVPRAEPADGLAGGKVVRIERAEMLTLPDSATRVAALIQGEVDYLEYAPIDLLPRLQRDRNIVISRAGGQARMIYGASINHTQPPFDNLLMRRALQQTLDRGEILAGAGMPAGMAQPECVSMFLCGTPVGNEGGGDIIRTPSLDRARALLREAGYNNERVAVALPADSILLNPFGLVLIDRMRRAGFNVDVQASDWSSIAQRWVQRAPLAAGGWSVVPVVYTGFDMSDPLSNLGTGFNCTGNQPWGYCVPEMTPVLQQFEAESDPARRLALATEIQRLAHENVTFPIAGQFSAPAAWRAELRGVIDFGFPAMWNIERAPR